MNVCSGFMRAVQGSCIFLDLLTITLLTHDILQERVQLKYDPQSKREMWVPVKKVGPYSSSLFLLFSAPAVL